LLFVSRPLETHVIRQDFKVKLKTSWYCHLLDTDKSEAMAVLPYSRFVVNLLDKRESYKTGMVSMHVMINEDQQNVSVYIVLFVKYVTFAMLHMCNLMYDLSYNMCNASLL